jgi:hypothetical protein
MRELIAIALLLATVPASAERQKSTCIGSCWQCMHGCTEQERIQYCCPGQIGHLAYSGPLPQMDGWREETCGSRSHPHKCLVKPQ